MRRIIVLLIAGLAMTSECAAQVNQSDSQTLQAILSELRELRAELHNQHAQTQTMQVLLFQMQMYQTAISLSLIHISVAGATDTVKVAIADAYQGLKSLVKKKFGDHSDVAEAIDKLEAKPDSGGRKETVLEELKAINSTSDPELVSAAQSLFKLIQALPQGEKHNQVAKGTGIAQADCGSTAVTMHAPPKKDD